MLQEVEVILSLDVDTSQSKEEIENFINDLINTHILHSSTYNRMIYPRIDLKQVKEEWELYDNK